MAPWPREISEALNLGTLFEENTRNTNAKMGKNDTQNNTLTLSGGTSTYLAHTLYMGVPRAPQNTFVRFLLSTAMVLDVLKHSMWNKSVEE